MLFILYLQDPSTCNQFQAGSNLRSKIKSQKLDETALFGAACRHEVPLKFFSLKRGEKYVLALIINETSRTVNIHIYVCMKPFCFKQIPYLILCHFLHFCYFITFLWVLFVSTNSLQFFYCHDCICYAIDFIFLLFRIGNAVFLLMWLKESIREKGIDLYLFYDIACVLHAHLKVSKWLFINFHYYLW